MAAGQVSALRRRIRTVKSTKKITKAQELVATSRIAKAQARVAASRPYAEAITDVLTALAFATSLVLLVLMSLCPVTCLIVLIIREIKSGWRYLSTRIPAEIEARVEKKKEEHYVRTGI